MTDPSDSKQDNKKNTKPHKNSWFKRLLNQDKTIEEIDIADIREDLMQAMAQGAMEVDTVEMIEGVINVADLTVRDIMIPRANIVTLQENQTVQEMLEIITESGHSRFPVLGADHEEVVGILLSKDLLKHFNQTDIKVASLLRTPQYESEEKSVNALLRDFKSNRAHLALVLDEYGLLSGIVTIEDVLEEIVGEIDDEHDKTLESPIREIEPNVYIVNAMVPIEAFNQAFGTHFDDEEADAIGGIIMMHLGRLPKDNEVIVISGLSFVVMPFNGKRLEMLEVTKLSH